MSKGLYFVTFAAGALIGSAVSYHFTKKKYEKISQDEINSVKESYERYYTYTQEREKIANEIIINNSGYSVLDKAPDIYVISPDEFAILDDYKIVGLTYFADKKLVDDSGNIVDIDSTVGLGSLSSFGEYADDAVYVRNDVLQTDYEILLDAREYLEVYPNKA